MEQYVYFDLTLNEIAIILHSFLKKSKSKYITINFHIEKYCKKLDEEDTYTLILIASNYRLSKYDLLNIYKKIMDANSIRYYKGDEA